MPRITKSGNPGPFLPGATVSWDITVTNTTEASTSLDDLVIDDLVPDQYDDGTPIVIAYVVGSASVVAKPALAPNPVIGVSVDPASGRTLIQWRWTAADSTGYSLAPGESITVRYEATLPDRVPTGADHEPRRSLGLDQRAHQHRPGQATRLGMRSAHGDGRRSRRGRLARRCASTTARSRSLPSPASTRSSGYAVKPTSTRSSVRAVTSTPRIRRTPATRASRGPVPPTRVATSTTDSS